MSESVQMPRPRLDDREVDLISPFTCFPPRTEHSETSLPTTTWAQRMLLDLVRRLGSRAASSWPTPHSTSPHGCSFSPTTPGRPADAASALASPGRTACSPPAPSASHDVFVSHDFGVLSAGVGEGAGFGLTVPSWPRSRAARPSRANRQSIAAPDEVIIRRLSLRTTSPFARSPMSRLTRRGLNPSASVFGSMVAVTTLRATS